MCEAGIPGGRMNASAHQGPALDHAFRETRITAYLANSGVLDHAQKMAAHKAGSRRGDEPELTPPR